MNAYFVQAKQYINNPVVISVAAVLVAIFATMMSHNLPPMVGQLVKHPLFKLVLIFGLLGLHRFNPLYAAIMIAVLILLIIVLSLFNSVSVANSQLPGQIPSEAELTQAQADYQQEVERRKDAAAVGYVQPKQEEVPAPVGLHPKNRPIEPDHLVDQRVIDPDDPRQPSIKIFDDPKTNVAIYELNPPISEEDQPGVEQPNETCVNLPEGGPTRYSAFNGYKLTK